MKTNHLENNTPSDDAGKNSKVKAMFSAFRHRNYRLWFTGQLTSLLGSWMQGTALGFLVYELTHSPAYLGYVGFASGIPAWLFSAYAGIIADRYPKRTIILCTQVFMMILAFTLAILTYLQIIQPYQIIIFGFLLGIANAFDAPARQSFVLEMVGREDMVNAIALNSGMFNTATAIGPAVAGLVYAAFGPAFCFAVNGVSFIGVIIALVKMHLPPFQSRKSNKSFLTDMKEGYHYLKGQRVILFVIIIVAVTCAFGMSFGTLFPAWAVKELHGDAAVNGFLQSARGVGAVFSALFLAAFSQHKIKGRLMMTGLIVFPIALIVFSFINTLYLSLLVLVCAGGSALFILNLANGMIQSLVSDEFRGRIMGIYTLTFFGMMPIGSLLVGLFAHAFGEAAALQINGTLLLLFALSVFFFVPRLRKIS
ncbi:MAG: MFS transporter [Ignavibacteria bacterium]|nr:MFS transporter [Ignavibacteria bacterium]